jgi:hypothetical protein
MITPLYLTACGGGGGGTTTSGATGAAVSKGVITAKGSVFVNGIEFNTAGATVRIDDNPGLESDLKVGMVVTVRGSSDDAAKKGTATLIEARDALEGTIEGIDNLNKTITVMGQTVRIEDNVTRLNDDDNMKVFAAAGFLPGDRVEVHAFADDQGGLRAMRVAKKAQGEFEIKGFVKSIGTGTFVLSLTPGGADALTVTGSLPAGAAVGSLVEVKADAAPVAGAITATLVKLEDRLGIAGEKVEVEGIVTSGTVDDFMVNGQRVITSSATLFEGGLRDDFAVGMKLEAEGPLDANGTIVATKISFRSNIKIDATASNVSATGLTVLGLNVAINEFTRVDNGPIADGNRVEVRAMLNRDGNLLATRIIVRGPDANQRAFLQGPVSSANAGAGTMTILGIAINTGAGTEFRISTDSSELAVDAATFFSRITPGVTVVKARWRPFVSTSAVVEQAEIELGR